MAKRRPKASTEFYLDLESDNPEMARAKINKSIRAALRRVGQFWERTLLPKRFEDGNRERYGWPQRDGNYSLRKLKRRSVGVDMVFSGRTRRTVLSGRTFDPKAVATASRQKVSVTVTVPAYVMMNRRYGYPLARDIVKNNRAESGVMGELLMASIDAELWNTSVSMVQFRRAAA